MLDNNIAIADGNGQKNFKHSGRKRKVIGSFFSLVTENIMTIIAIACVIILVYVTVLFITFNKEDNAANHSPDKGFHARTTMLILNQNEISEDY